MGRFGLSTRTSTFGLVALLCGTVLSGCSAPSLLITPVSGKRDLVETVLQRDSIWARDKIALIDVTGVIMNAPTPQLLGEGEHAVSYLLEQLAMARRDPKVRAVILRINSPGGSVVASELMYDEIRHFREAGKPVVAVMMDVAASGGYYIACACDEIVAQPSTVTGSIGVVMQLVDLSGTMEMIGIRSNAITSGDFKDAGSPFRALRDDERKLFQGIVDDMYGRFVKVVAEGRPNLDEAAVRELADGRVFTATQALEHGLIDRITIFREAIKQIRERIGAKRVQLVTYRRRTDYRPNYYALGPPNPPQQVNLIQLDVPLMSSAPRFMYLWAPGR